MWLFSPPHQWSLVDGFSVHKMPQPSIAQSLPPPRSAAAKWVDRNDVLWIFGGYTQVECFLGSVECGRSSVFNRSNIIFVRIQCRFMEV